MPSFLQVPDPSDLSKYPGAKNQGDFSGLDVGDGDGSDRWLVDRLVIRDSFVVSIDHWVIWKFPR
jgi:hypothetical protein